jgi:hypothetical protein
MAKYLTFNDGSYIEVAESSTIYDVIMVFTEPVDIMEIWSHFTRENMSHCMLNDVEYFDIVPLDLDLIKDEENSLIIARFESREMTAIELAKSEISKYMLNI